MVAETLDMHPQTLRKYERAGFVEPLRMGALRTYSDEDVARLRLIKHFVEHLGLNLSGVQLALNLTRELLELRERLAHSTGSSDAAKKSVKQIDGMLNNLGVRLVKRSESQPGPRPADEPEAIFNVEPGGALLFNSPR